MEKMQTKGELVIERSIDAARERVFDAWTDPVHIVEWWGLEGFTYSIKEMNVLPGGAWRMVMRGPDGKEYAPFNAVYKEVARPGRLAFEYVNADGSLFFKQTVLFEKTGDKTKLSIYLLFPSDQKDKDVKEYGAIEGLKHTLDRLEKYLAEESGGGLVITRVFDAPRELVWKEWSDPARMKNWWGPKYFTAPIIKMDFRAGGKYLWSMRSPDEKDFYSVGEYREIIPMKKIVYIQSFADEKGNVVPASYYGLPGDWPSGPVTATVTFEEESGKTTMIIREEGIPGGMMGESNKAGWETSLDKMEEDLLILSGRMKTGIIAEPGKQEAVITEIYDAPNSLVFNAYIDPKLIPKWWGPERLETTIDKLDAKPGGIWRFVQKDQSGEYAFHGVFHEVTAPTRLVQTFEWEGMPGHVILEIMELREYDGKTLVVSKSVFESVADRDGMLKSGMEESTPEITERLKKLMSEQKRLQGIR